MDADDPMRRRLALAAVLLAVVAWSASVLLGGFAYDDRQAIHENPVATGSLPVAEAFRRDYWHHVGDAGHYRPLATLSLRLDHALYGERAWGYHLTNVLLHALVVAGLAFLLLRLRGAGRGAFLGLLVFAVHPVLADSVAWISGRSSMISALGGVLALAAVVGLRRMPMVLPGVTLGLLVALLGKEDGVVFVLPVLVLAFLRARRLAVACVFSVVSALGVYLVLRAGALGAWLPSAPHAPLAEVAFPERLLFAGRGLLESARLVAFPFAFPPNYRAAPGFAAGDAPAAWAALGWLPWLALVAGGAWASRRGHASGRATLAVTGASCVLAALSLAPTLQLVPAGVVFAPRFLYLPLLFGVAAIGAVVRRLPSILPGVLIVVLVIGAWIRCGVYADVESYNRAILDHVPADAAAFNDLGLALEAQGHLDAAVTAWRSAVRMRPGYSRPWSNLGRIALGKGDLEDATRFFRHAAAAGPRNPVAHANLGSVLLRRALFAEAADAYEEATRIAPGMPAAWRGLGHALWKAGDAARARSALRRALALAPGDAQTIDLLRAVGADTR
jgi:Flp pilus assembly protein TadD